MLVFLQGSALCLDLPPLQGRVNDHAGILSAGAVAEIERRLAGLEKSDSTQLVLLTLPTLENEPIEQVAIRVAENWRIGQKGLDNGVILLIAHQEKKIRIEVGRGLEGKLTDLVSGRIIRNDIAPQFKLGNFDAGVLAGVDSIIATVKGEYRPDMKKADIRHGKKGLHPAITLAVFLLVAIVFLGSFSRFLGGIAGAVGLPLVAFLSFPPLGMALLAGLLVAGFILGLLVVALFGSGGGWRGGGFGGGGFGGFGGGSWGGSDGGFSGGGGDFGGGGASGDW